MKKVEIINNQVVLNDGICSFVLEPKEDRLSYDEAIEKHGDKMAGISVMHFILENLEDINEALQEVGEDKIDENDIYWCREQYSATRAWYMPMYHGYVSNEPRISTHRVRAVSAFESKNEESENFKLEPFDLERAHNGEKVCTRDGKDVRIICENVIDDTYPIETFFDLVKKSGNWFIDEDTYKHNCI